MLEGLLLWFLKKIFIRLSPQGKKFIYLIHSALFQEILTYTLLSMREDSYKWKNLIDKIYGDKYLSEETIKDLAVSMGAAEYFSGEKKYTVSSNNDVLKDLFDGDGGEDTVH